MYYLSGVECKGSRQLAADGYPVGVIAQPGNAVHKRWKHYPIWAADNGCFSQGEKFDLDDYLAYLGGIAYRSESLVTCKFAVSPDVVADPVATWERSRGVLPIIRSMGFAVAYVAQDGMELCENQWRAFDCLFMGGSTEYKLSQAADRVIAEAKMRGKWCHMGRCNSLVRFRHAEAAGYDSVDGTYLAFSPTANSAKLRGWLSKVRQQPQLNLWEGMYR